MVNAVIFVVLLISFLWHLYLKYLWSFRHKDCKSKVFLGGKCAIVTGGSSGIGYQIVLGLASRGCKVIIADCNVDESIKDAIYKETHNPNIVLKYVDLASFESVRKFADDILKTEEKVDILMNNAGIGRGSSDVSEDGLNCTMQVNYYSAFLLTHLLLDSLKKSPFGARIIFTASLKSYFHPLTEWGIREHGLEKGIYRHFPYAISKFSLICASKVFAEKLEGYGITSNCFHPTAANTNIFKKTMEGEYWYKNLDFLYGNFLAIVVGKTAEQAAQTGIYLACANEVKGVTGDFFVDLEPARKPRGFSNKELRKAIWEEAERVVKLKPNEKLNNLDI